MQDTGTEGGVDARVPANWVYELPFGQGRRFASGAGPWMNRVVGGWSFDGIARIQSGTTLDFGNVRLVGMTAKELQEFVQAAVRRRRASSSTCCRRTSSTTRFGRSAPARRRPRAMAIRACRPAGIWRRPTGPTASRSPPARATAACGASSWPDRRSSGSTSAPSKRIAIKGSTNFEFRAEFLNAFNTPWFEAVAQASNNPDNYRVTDADSGREIQFVFRVNW